MSEELVVMGKVTCDQCGVTVRARAEDMSDMFSRGGSRYQVALPHGWVVASFDPPGGPAMHCARLFCSEPCRAKFISLREAEGRYCVTVNEGWG